MSTIQSQIPAKLLHSVANYPATGNILSCILLCRSDFILLAQLRQLATAKRKIHLHCFCQSQPNWSWLRQEGFDFFPLDGDIAQGASQHLVLEQGFSLTLTIDRTLMAIRAFEQPTPPDFIWLAPDCCDWLLHAHQDTAQPVFKAINVLRQGNMSTISKAGFNGALSNKPRLNTLSTTDIESAQQMPQCWHPTLDAQLQQALANTTNAEDSPATLSSQCLSSTPSRDINVSTHPIAIIGGGIATAALCLSLAERSLSEAHRQITIFCQDAQFAMGASGNRQGALYPLLSADHNPLSQFYLQAFAFSAMRLHSLATQGHHIAHDFCGVLQTPYDAQSLAKLTRLAERPWPATVLNWADTECAQKRAALTLDTGGIFYPRGAWVSPAQYVDAMLAQAAKQLTITPHMQKRIVTLQQQDGHWWLQDQQGQQFGPFAQVILANGSELTAFSQTQALPLSPFRGQVSHIPAQGVLAELNCVLCAEGYLTPAQSGSHCLGASYVKGSKKLSFSVQEQQDNAARLIRDYPAQPWLADIDISANDARVGVRMVSRDHFPMAGNAPDTERLAELAAHYQHDAAYWQHNGIPSHGGLYLLGGLGSRGICSAPLTADILAAQILQQPAPVNQDILARLSPGRMWLRKLVKGRPIQLSPEGI